MSLHDLDGCGFPPDGIHDRVGVALGSSRENLGKMLEACRQYLTVVANQELGAELRARIRPSDLVQQTYLKAQRDLAQFRGSTLAQFARWLRQILRNELNATRRHYQSAEKRRVSREISLDTLSFKSIQQVLVANTPSPSSHLVQCEELQILNRALDRLAPHYRQVIELRQRDQLSFAEVAQRLQLSVPAAKKRWQRAIDRLRREMRGELIALGDSRTRQ
jgi:RNA polymerase sigma-70 factor (ECF subfamily)